MRSTLPFVMLAIALSSCGKKPTEPAPDSTPQPKPKLTALYRFWDSRFNEDVYTYGTGEPADWRKNSAFSRETVVGYISNEPVSDSTRLYRSIRRNNQHYFYINSPPTNEPARMEDFTAYVWTKPGDGRIPIHFCSLPDGTDPLFDRDMKVISDSAAASLRVQGLTRKVVENYFYVYPSAPPSGSTGQPASTAGANSALNALRAKLIGKWEREGGGIVKRTVEFKPNGELIWLERIGEDEAKPIDRFRRTFELIDEKTIKEIITDPQTKVTQRGQYEIVALTDSELEWKTTSFGSNKFKRVK